MQAYSSALYRLRTGLLAGCVALALAAPCALAGTLTVLHSFTGGADGSNPYKSATIDSAGNLYGQTTWGADACPDSYEYAGIGCGTTYALSPAGALKPLVTFLGPTNGAAGLANVTLYQGYVVAGADFGGSADLGLMFAVKTNGTSFKVLHTFKGKDGSHPNSFARIASNGTLYSVASEGGPAYSSTNAGDGVLFAITPSFAYVPEHYFSGGADGANPGRVFLDSSGTIYGSTNVGGGCSGTGVPANGCGVIYRFVPSTGVFTVLYTFTGGADGYLPQIGGIDAAGNLYGGTVYGGADGDGTLFELKNANGNYSYTLLYTFTGGADGANPYGPPSLAPNGTLVGTTFYGPVTQSGSGAGTLYTFKKGVLTTLFTFSNDANGGYPEGTPIMTSSGDIYGTTAFGGIAPCNTSGGTLISTYGCGVVYEYTP
jgi:uncharacterized repeat protein (TIGR03803 family)